MSETIIIPRIKTGELSAGEPAQAGKPDGAHSRFRLSARQRGRLPLVAILIVQASIALSLSNSIFIDEGCYLFSGHTEWAAMFGGPTPMNYATFFSGSPYLYPLIGAVANALGGLGAARGFSTLCMLAATVMLYRATVVLFGKQAAIWAAALFALCGPCLFMAHLATFDAPAVALLAAGFYFAVRSGTNKVLMLETIALTTLAVAFKYAALVYAVPMVLTAAVCAIPTVGWRWAAARGAVLGFLMFVTGFALLCIAGPNTVAGLLSTTLQRPPATNTVDQVAARSAVYVGFILILATFGTMWFSLRRRPRAEASAPEAPSTGPLVESWGWKPRALLALTLTGAALIAPVGDMRLHTLTSLEKHAGYGLMFAAPMGGWLIGKLAGSTWWRTIPAVVLVAALGAYGANQAHQFFSEWPTSTAYIKTLETLTASDPAGTHILAEDPWIERYYLGDAGNRFIWDDTYSLYFTDTAGKNLTGLPAYQAAISERYFGVVVIDYQATPSIDPSLDQALQTSGYQRTAVPAYDRYGEIDVEIWTLIGVRK